MDKWWPEPDIEKGSDPIDIKGGSGDNFAIVIFDTDGGSNEDGSIPHYMKVAFGGTVGRLRPISRGTDGFLGWYDENGNLWDIETRKVTKNDVNSDGYIILKIKWEKSSLLIYSIDFVTTPSSYDIQRQYVGSGGKVIQPVPPPALGDGRAFAGWYTEPGYVHRWNFDIPATRSEILYARWALEYITVKFNANGGVRPDGITQLTHEFPVFLNPEDFEDHESYELVQDPGPLVKTGYHFDGWYKNEDFSGEPWNFLRMRVTDPGVFDHPPQAGDVLILHAKWELNIYHVDFVITPSPAAVPQRQLITHGQKADKPANPPMLGDGRNFFAWYTENEHYNLWNFDDPVTSNMTLYARFTPQTRTVHFQPNGGVLMSGMEMRTSVTIPIASGFIIDPGNLKKTGFNFGGWFINPECTISWIFSTDRVTTPDEIIAMDPMYIYAKWTPDPYTVTLNFYEPAPPLIQTQNVEHGERAVKPFTPENTGRSLDGWFTQDGRSSEQWGIEWDFDLGTVTSNLVLHAKWVDSAYTVKFHFGRPNGAEPHSVYLNTNVHDQTHHIHDRVNEPFMPPLPSSDKTSWSFVRWDYHPGDPDTVPGADPVNVNNQVFRNALLSWDFDTEIDDTNTSSIGKVLNLYARWIPPDPDMVWVPRGSFIMGDSGVSGSPVAYHAYPTRKVTLDGFFISRYPVTQINSMDTNRGYQHVMGVMPSQFSRNTFRPVERVSWYDAVEFCYSLTEYENRTLPQPLGQVYTITNRIRAITPLSGTPGQTIYPITSASVAVDWNANGYRLPTEAEWEYAAKGGNGMGPYFIYSGSNDPNDVAWYNETVKSEPAGLQATQTVGRKNPNSLGIYDMSGNVSEWVWDRFISYKDLITLNPDDLFINPKGPATGTERVRRGGGWSNAAGNVRSVVRNSDTPDTATWVNGFRVVRGPSHIW